jgi:hypothetical protein
VDGTDRPWMAPTAGTDRRHRPPVDGTDRRGWHRPPAPTAGTDRPWMAPTARGWHRPPVDGTDRRHRPPVDGTDRLVDGTDRLVASRHQVALLHCCDERSSSTRGFGHDGVAGDVDLALFAALFEEVEEELAVGVAEEDALLVVAALGDVEPVGRRRESISAGHIGRLQNSGIWPSPPDVAGGSTGSTRAGDDLGPKIEEGQMLDSRRITMFDSIAIRRKVARTR